MPISKDNKIVGTEVATEFAGKLGKTEKAASATTADAWAGANKTISTVEPSNSVGKDGDIWFVYE